MLYGMNENAKYPGFSMIMVIVPCRNGIALTVLSEESKNGNKH